MCCSSCFIVCACCCWGRTDGAMWCYCLSFYSVAVCLRTDRFNIQNSTWYSHCVECFVRNWEQRDNFALYYIDCYKKRKKIGSWREEKKSCIFWMGKNVTKLLRSTGNRYRIFKSVSDIPEGNIVHLWGHWFFPVIRAGNAWYFQKTLVCGRYQSANSSEFKCVNITSSRPESVWSCFRMCFWEKLILILFPFPTHSMTICSH